jgi:hypothetical protein
MTKFNWRALGEVVGLFSVVASLIFVGFQLKLDHTLARSELASEGFTSMSRIAEQFSDPQFSALYAKMLEQPTELSVEEMVRINGFLTQVTDLIARECYLTERGVYVECDNLVNDSVRRYFGNAYAQSWWRVADTRPQVVLPPWLDDKINNTSQQLELDRIKTINTDLLERKSK